MSVGRFCAFHRTSIYREADMVPGIILWLLGVPLGVVILLWLFGIIGN
jgi:hypothetical protein